jgi:hypothetical protein
LDERAEEEEEEVRFTMSSVSTGGEEEEHVPPFIGSYGNMLDFLDEENPSENDERMSHWLSTRGTDMESVNLPQRQAAAALGDRASQKNLIPTFHSETLQFKLSRIYGHDFGSLPFDMANVEDDNAFLVQPEDRKKVEKNYQVLIAIKMFQESLVQIYGPVGDRVITVELRNQICSEGLTSDIIEHAHAAAVGLYKAEKADKLKQIKQVGDLWRRESQKAKLLSESERTLLATTTEDQFLRAKRKGRMVSIDLGDEGADCFLDNSDLNQFSNIGEDECSKEDDESSVAELDFVTDYKTSVLDAKKAFAKNWVVMQAAEFELMFNLEDFDSAKNDVDCVNSRDTFCRLTIVDRDDTSNNDLTSLKGESLEETDAQLSLLGEEVHKVMEFEKFYRNLRKKPKTEFKDPVLVADIVSNIDILIKVVVKKRKELESRIRHLKTLRIKIKLVNRPIPRLLFGAKRRNSDANSASASASASTSANVNVNTADIT